MKRAICILTVMICCICSTARTETHIGIQGTIVSETENKTVLFDLFSEEDKTTLISSTLAPDYAVRIPEKDQAVYTTARMLFGISPESIALFMSRIDELYQGWMKTRYSESAEGIYSGPVFKKASSVCVTEFMLSDFTQYISNERNLQPAHSDGKQTGSQADDLILLCFTEAVGSLAAAYNPLVRIKSYDNDSYISVDLLKQDQVILTISMDNTKGNDKRILITHKENNRYYFHDIYALVSMEEIWLLSNVYRGRGPAFENVTEKDLLISESISLKTDQNNICRINYACGTEKKGNILSMNGMTSSDRLEGVVSFQDGNKENIKIEASLDTKKPDMNPDQIKVMESDSAEYRMAFMTGTMLFLADIIPLLPPVTQTTLYQLFFNP
ncbi:MAG: hypothetical protein IKZ98_09755 [Clostridia bacterium]|nr:hypothetical protein [Clostridia bacterium]